MKFIHYIEKISGVDRYGITSLLVFVLFFTAMLVWVYRTKKERLDEQAHIPLD
ncbi:cbb3-type cytochrome oxidase subunit 3 [Flavihumibacter petaseus]|uniref:Cbb3-type cytochrome c oxidase subunit IV n=1 Tax=Flavihumibacter petaseus NBRC 106054 TaxID=1220578 RepID=A0A0E9N751_9BACT|nr:CcoQ/FixQ family Cbb3-type cytochrome c oxidase assembly chaperone [Flavihumibacter petaseus]GAO45175.1 cbb3-type cytochrome c oxidase subunit IV [Flavihumibacter petaseus NBRC 106054]